VCYIEGDVMLRSETMKQETMRFLVLAAIYSFALFGFAFLVGCSVPVKYVFDCTVVQPKNCN